MFIGARANCMSVFVWVQIYYTVCGTAQFDGSIQLMLNSKWINTLLEKTVLQATAHLCWINHSKIFILTRSQATTPFTINTAAAMKSVALNKIPNFSVTLKHTNTHTHFHHNLTKPRLFPLLIFVRFSVSFEPNTVIISIYSIFFLIITRT